MTAADASAEGQVDRAADEAVEIGLASKQSVAADGAGVPPLSRSVRQAKRPVARGYLLGCSGECPKSGRYLPMPSGWPPCVTI